MSPCERGQGLDTFGGEEQGWGQVWRNLTFIGWHLISKYQMNLFPEIVWARKSISGEMGRLGLMGLAECGGRGHSWAL